MRLVTRVPVDAELDALARLIDDGFESRIELREYLAHYWRRLVQDEAITMVLIEDRDADVSRPVAFGALVFVADVAIDTLLTEGRPYLTRTVVDHARRNGGYGGVLGRRGIAEANGRDGLNVMVLHCGEIVAGYSAGDRARIRKRLIDTLIKSVAGFNLKQIVFEFFGKDDLPYLTNAGLVLRTDYAALFAGALDGPAAHAWPCLVGLTREEAAAKTGTRIAELFGEVEQRFDFTEKQLDVLSRAFQGQSDNAIAEALNVPRNTVIMRWRTIYDTVERLIPGFFDGPVEPSDTPVRDAKRRLLLKHLEDFADELRPRARRK